MGVWTDLREPLHLCQEAFEGEFLWPEVALTWGEARASGYLPVRRGSCPSAGRSARRALQPGAEEPVVKASPGGP